MSTTKKIAGRIARKRRIRARIQGTAARPRLSVHRSLTAMSAQMIDDEAGKTLCSASTKELKKGKNLEAAQKLGELLAKKAKDAGVKTIVFDRNAYAYHGRVKAFAEALREAGLQF